MWIFCNHSPVVLPKILLFYVFTPLPDPDAVRVWQLDLCRSLGLRGRIIVSPHGINATVGGEMAALKRYTRSLREYSAFRAADVKWSNGSGLTDEPGPSGYREILDFPRLSVKAREEIVTFGAPDELVVDAQGVVGGGEHLQPRQVHELVEQRGEEVVFFDGRNAFEAEIGRFEGAVVPDAATTTDLLAQLDAGEFDHLKDKPVVTYCTGGIRCEVLTSLMKNRGFEEVYQLDGGIVRYAERYGNEGLWKGELYVFDKRTSLSYGAQPALVGTCVRCSAPTNRMDRCEDDGCRERVVVCEDCAGAGVARCLSHD